MRRSPLQVWLHDTHVATLTGTRTGTIDCRYTPQALDRWDLNVPLLSCSMPLRGGKASAARTFFRGLLPEGEARNAMAALAGVPVTDTIGMLDRFGRDVAGATVVTRDAAPERTPSVERYDAAGLAAEVGALAENPLALHDDSELSLAGLQDKLLLVRTHDGWGRPRHGHPSTHLLKVEDRRFPGMAALECAAMHLAKEVGLTTVTAHVLDVDGAACLVVERFDRATEPDGRVRRLHQEDVCQALAVDADAARGRGKYEDRAVPHAARRRGDVGQRDVVVGQGDRRRSRGRGAALAGATLSSGPRRRARGGTTAGGVENDRGTAVGGLRHRPCPGSARLLDRPLTCSFTAAALRRR